MTSTVQEYDPTKPFNEQIRKTIEETWQAARQWNISIGWDGKRSSFVKKPGYPWSTDRSITRGIAFREEADFTDGIGTKAFLHWQRKSFGAAAQDAAAMVFDDAIEKCFVPYKLQDHIMIETDDDERGKPAIHALTRGLTDVCLDHRVLITGGETAILNTLNGFEMGITASGVRLYDPPSGIRSGDAIIGLRSSGIHSNGLTFARNLYFETLDLTMDHKLADGKTVGEALTTPTTIYLQELVELLEKGKEQVHGLVHITGGGLSKLHELAPHRDYEIIVDGSAIKPHVIFTDMYGRSQETAKPLTAESMHTKFNGGTGYAVAVHPDFEQEAMDILGPHNPVRIDQQVRNVVSGKGHVRIVDSPFGGKDVTYAKG